MLTLRPFSRRMLAVRLCTWRGSKHCYFHYACRFATFVLAHMVDSLVSVSRRGKENHFCQHHKHRVTDLSPTQDSNSGHSPPRKSPTHWRFTPNEEPLLTHAMPQHPYHRWQEKYEKALAMVPLHPFQQCQVPFNSLFKVLCIFPSRYLCTISIPPIFSFRWNLPPNLSCNPKQLDS